MGICQQINRHKSRTRISHGAETTGPESQQHFRLAERHAQRDTLNSSLAFLLTLKQGALVDRSKLRLHRRPLGTVTVRPAVVVIRPVKALHRNTALAMQASLVVAVREIPATGTALAASAVRLAVVLLL